MRRRLDVELVRRGLVPTRAGAAAAIRAGRVLVGGAPATSAARQVDPHEAVTVSGPGPRFVSRGGEKLDAALDRFAVRVAGRRGLDAGASTGGFTDCLLQRGIAEVVAVDVGRGQLAWSVREDPRVQTLERTNIRHLGPDAIGGPRGVVVVDLSFISLRTVAAPLAALTADDGDLIALVKPQFEVGRPGLGKGGIVRDPGLHSTAVRDVVTAMRDASLMTEGVMPSPLHGADGNIEFLIHCTRSGPMIGPDAVRAAVAEAHA